MDDQLWIDYSLTTTDPVSEEEIPLESHEELPHHYGIVQGQTITLYWTTYHAEQVTIEHLGPVPPSGSHILAPDKLSMYTITARRSDGQEKRQPIVVNVFPVPQIETLTQVPTQNIEITTDLHLGELPDLPDWQFREELDKLKTQLATLNQLEEEAKMESEKEHRRLSWKRLFRFRL